MSFQQVRQGCSLSSSKSCTVFHFSVVKSRNKLILLVKYPILILCNSLESNHLNGLARESPAIRL